MHWPSRSIKPLCTALSSVVVDFYQIFREMFRSSKTQTIMQFIPGFLIGYLIAQNLIIPFPEFHPGKEILKLVKEGRPNQPEGFWTELSSLVVGKMVDAAVNYEETNYFFFKIITVPIMNHQRLCWVGILGNYFFYNKYIEEEKNPEDESTN